MSISRARREDIPRLKKLWTECFKGDEEFSERYFSEYFDENCGIMLLGDDGSLQSAVYYFDMMFRYNGTDHPVIMLYAVGTFPEYRCRGNIRKLFDFLSGYCAENGISGMVLSAEDEYKAVYEKCGGAGDINLSETVLRPGICRSPISFENCSFGDFASMRNSYLNSTDGSFFWKERELRFVYSDLVNCGDVLKTHIGGKEHYAVISTEGGISVKETDIPPECGGLLADSLAVHYSYSGDILFCGKTDRFYKGNVVRQENVYFGHRFLTPLISVPDPGNMYFNLILD